MGAGRPMFPMTVNGVDGICRVRTVSGLTRQRGLALGQLERQSRESVPGLNADARNGRAHYIRPMTDSVPPEIIPPAIGPDLATAHPPLVDPPDDSGR